MGCSICRDLELALASRSNECVLARTAAYSRVSSRFVAYDIVEMERARSELAMHRSVCVYAVREAGGRYLSRGAATEGHKADSESVVGPRL